MMHTTPTYCAFISSLFIFKTSEAQKKTIQMNVDYFMKNEKRMCESLSLSDFLCIYVRLISELKNLIKIIRIIANVNNRTDYVSNHQFSPMFLNATNMEFKLDSISSI